MRNELFFTVVTKTQKKNETKLKRNLKKMQPTMNAVKKLKKNDNFCDLAPPRKKIKIPGPSVDSHVNKMIIREKS
jgi:hypothetical protein